jgi:hypothetical protein
VTGHTGRCMAVFRMILPPIRAEIADWVDRDSSLDYGTIVAGGCLRTVSPGGSGSGEMVDYVPRRDDHITQTVFESAAKTRVRRCSVKISWRSPC